MKSFEETGLSAPLLKAVAELGFTEPTPVQAKVIPLLLQGERDVVALAQTGTGKTAAFGLPLLELTDPEDRAIQALVLSPTRELCLQIARDLADFARFAPHLRVLPVYGGAPISGQMRALRQGVHILVATPGRINDLMRRGAVKLDEIRRVVLDEADEMLNMGFQEDLETILQEVPEDARTLLFSATMPKQVAAMASKYLKDPEEIILGQRNAGAEKVTHECYMVHARDRYHALKRIIDARPGFYGIVFCRTRAETQEVASHLVADGYNADTLHGDLSQDQRDRVMKSFRHRVIHILVATDVAARGLDVDDLTHVINYDLPGDPDVYTHRSGRTGRAGKAGVSIVLIHMREEYKIRSIERIMNKRFEFKDVPGGREVVEARLVELMQQIRGMEGEGPRLDPFIERMNAELGDLSRDELLRRFTLREMGRLIEYYRTAPDINVHRQHYHHGERPERNDRRGPRFERGPRPGSDEPMSGGPAGDMVRMRVNIGHRNDLTTAALIGVINRATPGPKAQLGRIRILEQDSLFEIAASAAEVLVHNLNRADYNGRPVRAVIDQDGPPMHRQERGPRGGGYRPRHGGGGHHRHGRPPR